MPPLWPLPEASPSTIERYARAMNKKMFNGNKFRFTLANVVKFLNQLSGYANAPHNNIQWWYALLSVIAIESTFKQLGIRGTNQQQQAKQCIAAAMLHMENDKVINKPFFHRILPQTNEECRNDWDDKCVVRKNLLEVFDEPEFFCDNGQTFATPSSAIILIHRPCTAIYYVGRNGLKITQKPHK